MSAVQCGLSLVGEKWRTSPRSIVPDVTGVGNIGPTPSDVSRCPRPSQADERFGHMHTMIDSDEEPLVRETVIDAGHSSVLLPDTESHAVLGSFGAGFSRQHTQQGDHVIPRVAPIQSAGDDETQMLDALERDLAGPVVFPLSDGAEVDVAHVGRPRQSRRLVLIPQSGTPRSVQDRSHSESASVEDQVVSDDTESLHGEGVCC